MMILALLMVQAFFVSFGAIEKIIFLISVGIKKYKIYKICLIIIYKTLVMILTLDIKSFLKNHPSMSFKEILL